MFESINVLPTQAERRPTWGAFRGKPPRVRAVFHAASAPAAVNRGRVWTRGTDWVGKSRSREPELGLKVAPVTIFVLHPTMDSAS